MFLNLNRRWNKCTEVEHITGQGSGPGIKVVAQEENWNVRGGGTYDRHRLHTGSCTGIFPGTLANPEVAAFLSVFWYIGFRTFRPS